MLPSLCEVVAVVDWCGSLFVDRHGLVFVVCCSLMMRGCLLSAHCCFWVSPLFIAYCLLLVDWCWCIVVHCLLFVVRCLLFVGCCLMAVDCCCLSLLTVCCCWLLAIDWHPLVFVDNCPFSAFFCFCGLFVVCVLMIVVRCLSVVRCHLLFFVRCWMFVVPCLLHVVSFSMCC